jgi:hypothetical protein
MPSCHKDPTATKLKTHKAGGVVIPHSLGVPKGLQEGIGTDDLIFQSPLMPKIEEGRETIYMSKKMMIKKQKCLPALSP